MARTGRPPKPTQLHQLHGTFRPKRHGKRVDGKLAAGTGDLDEPPPDLTDSQEDVWRYCVANMPRGVMKRVDRDMLMIWCEARDRWNTARLMQAELDRDSRLKLLIKTPEGLAASPYHDILDKTSKTMIRVAQELGFSPAARARIKAEPDKGADTDDPERVDPWKLLVIPGGKTDPAA
jgi:P27 family predicted phage terminase small subunit